MKMIKINNSKYRKAKWWEEHEMLGYIIAALIFWAVVLTAYFI